MRAYPRRVAAGRPLTLRLTVAAKPALIVDVTMLTLPDGVLMESKPGEIAIYPDVSAGTKFGLNLFAVHGVMITFLHVSGFSFSLPLFPSWLCALVLHGQE